MLTNANIIKNRYLLSLFSTLCVMIVLLTAIPVTVNADGLDPETEKIISGIEQRYAGKEFSASYEQTSILKALDTTETASGKVFFSHPGKMRWEYNEPEVHQIISDGVNLWIYKPDEKQVSKGSASTFFKEGAGGAFLSDISTVRKNYSIKVNSADSSIIELNMIPKKKTPDISSVTITVSKNNYNIKKVVTFNAYGDATELLFSDITFSDLDDSLFKFTIPEGVDVIYMD